MVRAGGRKGHGGSGGGAIWDKAQETLDRLEREKNCEYAPIVHLSYDPA